jgi:hypothetical protein
MRKSSLAAWAYLSGFIAILGLVAAPAALAQKVSGNFPNGSVRVGDDSGTCNASRYGAIRFNTNKFQGCSTGGWVDIGTFGGGGGGMTALTGDVTASGSGSVATTIAANAIGSAEITDGTIALGDLSATGTKDNTTFLRGDNTWATIATGLPGLAAAKVWVGNAGGAATAVSLSGDATVDNAGVLTIGTGAVGSTEITDASIGLGDLAATGTKNNTTFLRGDNTWAAAGDNLGNHTATTSLTMANNAIVNAGQITTGAWNTTYDAWYQGGVNGATGGARNLALLGTDNDSGDTLYLNYGGEYAGGTIIGGTITLLNSSLQFSSFGGGWYMSDTTWIRAFGDKNVYTPATIRADTAIHTTQICNTSGTGCVAQSALGGGGSVPQGTYCGYGYADSDSSNVQYYGCNQIFTWGGTSGVTCLGTNVATACPTGYTRWQYIEGVISTGGYNVNPVTRCARVCVKS